MQFDRIWLQFCAFFWRFSRVHFYRDLADAIRRRAGIRDHLSREASNKAMLGERTSLAVMRHLIHRQASGQGVTLRELLATVTPKSDALLLMTVDSASDKVAALESVATTVGFQIESLKILGKNLLMPILALPIVGTLCVITAQIIEGVASDAPPAIWTGFNAQVRTVAEFINAFWPMILVVLIVLVCVLVYLLPRSIGSWRLKVDEFPGFRLFRDYNAALVLSSLSMMLSSGKTLRQSIDDMSIVASPWLRWHLRRMAQLLDENPTDYLGAFSRGLMPKTVRARLASLLDSSRSFDEALLTLGTKEVDRLKSNVDVSAQALNWTLTGTLVAVAVYLSIGQMTIVSALSREAEPARLMQKR